MSLHRLWEALLQPGSATDFFVAPLPSDLDVEAPAYSASNAWWLAEISRLVYVGGAETRRRLLEAAKLEEVAFIDQTRAQCSIVKPVGPGDPRFVVLVFRGSHDLRDWLTNAETWPVPWPPAPGLVHDGFRDAFNSVVDEMDRVLAGFPCPAFYTGHSLGAALATLAAHHRRPQAVYTFGSPRVGDADFLAAFAGIPVYRVVNSRDVVATLPPAHLGGYSHVGELHYMTRDGRTLLDPADELTDQHRPFVFHPRWWDELHLLAEPPEEMADHAPIHYVTRLRAALH